MSASIKGVAGLQFGVATIVGVIMQSAKQKLDTKVAELFDEDGDPAGFSFYSGGRTSLDGRYALKGAASALASHISSGVIASSISGLTALGGGTVYLVHVEADENHDQFAFGAYSAIAAAGITG
ncbi:MAG: hypothetical protein ABSA97_07335 [Verrucomicrobiia bacterium]